MLSIIAPVLFALAVWWGATVLMMRRSLSAPPRCRTSMAVITVLVLPAMAALFWSLDKATVSGAYVGFVGGMALWAWHELSYFLGFVSGPRPQACSPGASIGQRFVMGVKASLYHELAIIFTAAALWALSVGAANQTGLWTFVLFWAMRWSAKLNIFLGVRNLHLEFWPAHLRYLDSYVGKPGRNWLMPLSLAAAGLCFGWLLLSGVGTAASDFERTSALLLATMLGLALMEHVFLVLRVPDAWLWRLATGDPAGAAAPAAVEWRARPES
jgi:putative photosynthetic complex assembly protein 2